MSSLAYRASAVDPLAVLRGFRTEFYACLTSRADELFELEDALLCTDGPVKTLVGLTLAPEHQRGHGALYDAINHGQIEVERLQRAIACLPLPRTDDGRLVLAVDVSPWLRPDAATCPDRSFCHTYGRGRSADQMIPGWPYSVIAALEPGRTSWTALLDAQRLAPGADVAAVTATQVRECVTRLIEASAWRAGDPPILMVFDAGYDLARLAYLLRDLPLQVLGRTRSDRVMYQAPLPPELWAATGPEPRHGPEFVYGDPGTWSSPERETLNTSTRYGTVRALAFDRLHPKLTRRAAWSEHTGTLPVIEGTVIRLEVERMPTGGACKPLWLWFSATALTSEQVDQLWQAYLRRFDIEHTFRMLKQTLGWTRPRLRSPDAADRWTWMIIAAYTQLRLARALATDLRRPWERPYPPERLTPARVRRGFRNLRAKCPSPAGAPKPSRPGPGRPKGSKNTNRAARHEVGLAAATGQAHQRPSHHKKGTKPRRRG